MKARQATRKRSPVGALHRFEHLPWQVGTLPILVLIAYWNSLSTSFHFDDFALLGDPYVVGPGLGWETLRLQQTRPLTYLTFHWNYLVWGANPVGYHWVNLILHAANVILVLLIGRRCLPPLTALIGAALYAVHPLQTQAVTYVFQRASLLATFFALLAFLFFLRERYVWSTAAFGLSIMAKEETIALPFFLLLYDLVWKKRKPRLGYYAAVLGLAMIAGVRLFYVLHTVLDPTLGFRVKGVSSLSYVLTQMRVVWIYLRLFVLPFGLNLDHYVPLSQGLFRPSSTLLALVGLLVVIGTLAWMTWKGKQPALWALGFVVLLAPSSSVVPVADVMFEHRTYFPLTCLVMSAAWLLSRLPRKVVEPTVAVLLVGMLAGTVTRNLAWHDEKSLWSDVVKKSPHKGRGYANLAWAYWPEDITRCRQLLESGLEVDPDNDLLHNHLGIVLMAQRDARSALQHFRQAMALTHETAEGWNDISAALSLLGETDQAIEGYRRATALDPCIYAARVNLMGLLLQQGKKQEASLALQIPTSCVLTLEQTKDFENYRRQLDSN